MKIFKMDPKTPDSEALDSVVSILDSGGVIGYPTDTIYGLGANINEQAAVEKIIELKGRQKDKPILILAAWLEQVQSLVESFPETAKLLASYLWPGPLTLVLPAAKHVSPLLTGGFTTIGVRIPSHKISLELVRRLGSPITSTSANLSGQPNPTCAEDVVKTFGDKLDAVIDSGKSPESVPSTIVSVSTTETKILREGAIPAKKIEEILGNL